MEKELGGKMKKTFVFVAVAFAFATISAQNKKSAVVVSETTATQRETNAKGYWGPLYGTEETKVKGISVRTVKDTKRTANAPDLLYEAETPVSLSDVLPVLHTSLLSELAKTGVLEILTEGQGNAEYAFEAVIEDFTGTRAEEISKGKFLKWFSPVSTYEMTLLKLFVKNNLTCFHI